MTAPDSSSALVPRAPVPAPAADRPPAGPRPRGSTLLVDADDTLWENNIYFDEVVSGYVALVERHGRSAAEARAKLLEIERERTRRFGYGIDNFRLSLEAACVHLLAGRNYAEEISEIQELCWGLRRRAILLLPGVDETLRELASRHRLILVTKGDHDDQSAKVTRSGLRSRFHEVDIVAEKDAATYRELIRRHGVDPARTWMIGNSPKSDILPALEASLRAVFIPHAATWTLELQELPTLDDGRLLVVERFADLTQLF